MLFFSFLFFYFVLSCFGNFPYGLETITYSFQWKSGAVKLFMTSIRVGRFTPRFWFTGFKKGEVCFAVIFVFFMKLDEWASPKIVASDKISTAWEIRLNWPKNSLLKWRISVAAMCRWLSPANTLQPTRWLRSSDPPSRYRGTKWWRACRQLACGNVGEFLSTGFFGGLFGDYFAGRIAGRIYVFESEPANEVIHFPWV